MEYKLMTLDSLNSGAAKELFDEELRKVLANINDLNCEPDATREIKLVVKIKPSKDLQSAVTSVQATSKLAGLKPHEGSVFLSFHNGKPKAYVNDHRQMDFVDEEASNKRDGE